jgi:hypothetical protein
MSIIHIKSRNECIYVQHTPGCPTYMSKMSDKSNIHVQGSNMHRYWSIRGSHRYLARGAVPRGPDAVPRGPSAPTLLQHTHYGSRSLPRVSITLGEDPKTLGEGFPECNTRGRPTGEAVHGEDAFPECQISCTRRSLPRVSS